MANFGPPTIVYGFQAVTQIAGVYADFFVAPQQIVPLDASRRGEALGVPTKTEPPTTFQQVDD